MKRQNGFSFKYVRIVKILVSRIYKILLQNQLHAEFRHRKFNLDAKILWKIQQKLQFVPRPQKFEQIVRQAVECGVKYIVPVFGEYSEKSSIQALSASGNKKERIERIMNQLARREGTTEALKAADQMEWVRHMNSIRARAEEIVLSELVYG